VFQALFSPLFPVIPEVYVPKEASLAPMFLIKLIKVLKEARTGVSHF